MASQNRSSNIELLRIVIMFMIPLLHANVYTFDEPTDHSLISFSRCFAQVFTITPVNIFILITGFFGTRFSLKKILGLIYMVIFCVIPISAILVACKVVDYNNIFFAIHKYWFINAYIGLLVLTPVLNAAVKLLSKKDYSIFLVSFYALVFISNLLDLSEIEMRGGYSLMWFVFLYMLGRYLRLYPLTFSTNQLLLVLITSCLCQTLIYFYFQRCDYVEPFVLIQSVSTLLLFSKFKIKSQIINSIAASVTMVYLINLQPILINYFKYWLHTFYENHNMIIFLLYTLLLCVAIFVFAIIYDQLRIYTWKKINLIAYKIKDIKQ